MVSDSEGFTQRLFLTKLKILSILTRDDEAKIDVAGRQWVLTWCNWIFTFTIRNSQENNMSTYPEICLNIV